MHALMASRVLGRGALTRRVAVCSPRRFCSKDSRQLSKISRGISIAEASKNGNGEDALFIQNCDIGVFDGVGGWRDSGIDPGIYSRQLSDGVSDYISTARTTAASGGVDLGKALDFGAESCREHQLTGSSTACIASLDKQGRQLRCLNLGDSGLVVFRRSMGGNVVVAHKAEITPLGFNFPRQIGNIADPKLGSMQSDTSADATLEVFPLQAGDVAVTASDGVWDNLFDEDIAAILEQSSLIKEPSGSKLGPVDEGDVDEVVQEIISAALKKSVSKAKTPWSVAVVDHYKRHYVGGKPDDMTVIVSCFFDD